MTESDRAVALLRTLLYPDGDDIRANGDGTITMPASIAMRLIHVIGNSAYL